MEQYFDMYKRYIRITLFLMAAFVLGWGFTPYHPVFLGLLLGTSFSLYNLWNMHRKIHRFGQAAAEGTRVRSLGTLSRILTGALAVLIAIRYPEWFHLVSVVVGVMTFYIIMLIDVVLRSLDFMKEKR
jgi:ATP synthase protein I